MSEPEKAERHTATTTLSGMPPSDAVAHLRAGAQDRGLTFEANGAQSWLCQTPLGDIELRQGREHVTVSLISQGQDRLQTLRDALMLRIESLSPALAQTIVWTGGAETGLRPPNFRLVRVASVERIGPTYLRVRVSGEKLESFARSGLHFRLLLPPDRAVPPEWPTVGQNGKTIWPQGEEMLHRPVYTIRRIDEAAGYFEFDVFQHPGGRASDWAAAVSPGETVGIMGPGGGWYPEAGWLLLAGDETALPAIARILESVPQTTKGVAHIQVASPADHIELARPPGIEANWLYRGADAPGLSEAVIATPLPEQPDRFVWFGGEWEDAKLLRQHFRDTLGLERSEFRIATYWTATPEDRGGNKP